jgi:lysophospholipase L1-like esterase
MKLWAKHTGLGILFIVVASQIFAQPFAADIAAFKKQDSLSFPAKNAILFAGSSSFTNWRDVQDYFPAYTIINRGFGGSSLTDLIRYQYDIIFPYQPKQIIIYCGENDIAAADTISGRIVFERFKQFFSDVRSRFPNIPLAYISMKPSPSRWHMKERMMEGNELIKKYLRKKKRTKFINVWNAMLGYDGKPIEDIFTEDSLHMNARGYAIWKRLIEPVLIE